MVIRFVSIFKIFKSSYSEQWNNIFSPLYNSLASCIFINADHKMLYVHLHLKSVDIDHNQAWTSQPLRNTVLIWPETFSATLMGYDSEFRQSSVFHALSQQEAAHQPSWLFDINSDVSLHREIHIKIYVLKHFTLSSTIQGIWYKFGRKLTQRNSY